MTTETVLREPLKVKLESPIFEDIPSYSTYSARRERLFATNSYDVSLPEGFKEVYNHASAWSGQTIDSSTLVYNLSEEDVAETEKAMETCKSIGYSRQ